MSKKLIAIHSIQTTDKDGNRIDVRPGAEFEAATAKEAGDLIARGAARSKASGETAAADATSTADGLPTPPAGYAPGTAAAGDVASDPNAPDSGNADPDTAKGEAARGESSTRSTRR